MPEITCTSGETLKMAKPARSRKRCPMGGQECIFGRTEVTGGPHIPPIALRYGKPQAHGGFTGCYFIIPDQPRQHRQTTLVGRCPPRRAQGIGIADRIPLRRPGVPAAIRPALGMIKFIQYATAYPRPHVMNRCPPRPAHPAGSDRDRDRFHRRIRRSNRNPSLRPGDGRVRDAIALRPTRRNRNRGGVRRQLPSIDIGGRIGGRPEPVYRRIPECVPGKGGSREHPAGRCLRNYGRIPGENERG